MKASSAPRPDFGDRFEIQGELGRGAMGVVYDAADGELGRRVALKTLPSLSSEEHRHLRHEFRLLRDVRHPNVVGLHELFGDESGRTWFTMELIEGAHFPEAFAAIQARGDDEGMRSLVVQVAEAIDAIHRTGTVHRDIKPTNIMVRPDGTAKVLDFGLADTRRRLQLDERTAGTLAYLAPEALFGSATPASDWYGLGAVLLEAASGAPPRASLGLAPEPAEIDRALGSRTPEWLRDVVLALLRAEPAERAGLAAVAKQARASTRRSRPGHAFVGRARELATLRALFEQTLASDTTRIVSLVGDPGIGKSRLLERFLGTLPRSRELVVLAGKCHHTEHIPYRALDPVLNDLDLVVTSRAAREPRYRELAERWQAATRQREQSDIETQVPTEHRRVLVDTLRAIVDALAADTQLLLVLDDAQWGDAESAELLLELLRERPRALVVLAQRREAEPGPFLDALAGEPLWDQREVVDLGPLADTEARALATLLAPGLDPDAARAVSDKAGGLPFAVESWAYTTRTGQVPSSFDALLGARVGGLAAPARDLLRLLALDPEPVPRAVALEAARFGAEGLVALRELEALGLLRFLPGEAQVGLYHELLREGVVEELRGDERRELHARMASAIEELAPLDHPRRMHHLAGAERFAEAAEVAALAAERASSELAFVREATFLGRAIGWCEDPARRLALRRREAAAWTAAGRASSAGDSFRGAAREARALGRPATEVESLRREAASALVAAGRVDEGEALFEALFRERRMRFPKKASIAIASGMWHRLTAHARKPREPRPVAPERAAELALLQLAGARLTVSRMHTGFALMGRFYARAMREGDAQHQAHAIISEAPFQAGLGGMWERRALRLLERIERLAREHGLPAALTPHQVHGTVAWQLGQWARAANANEAAGAILRREAPWDTMRLLVADSFGCSARAFMGDFDTLGDRVEIALQAAVDRGERNAHVLLDAGDTGVRYFVRGDADGAERLARRVWDLVPSDAGVFEYSAATHEARTHLYLGRYAEGVEALERALPRLRRNQAIAVRVPRAVTYDLLARLLLGLGKERGLAPIDARLREAIGEVDKTGLAPASAWAERSRAARARLAGHEAEAERRYARAERRFEDADMRLFAWACARARGEAAAAPARVADEDGLLGLLDPLSR